MVVKPYIRGGGHLFPGDRLAATRWARGAAKGLAVAPEVSLSCLDSDLPLDVLPRTARRALLWRQVPDENALQHDSKTSKTKPRYLLCNSPGGRPGVAAPAKGEEFFSMGDDMALMTACRDGTGVLCIGDDRAEGIA